MASFRKIRRTKTVSILLMLVVSFTVLAGCVGCFGQTPEQQESACCKHNKNCTQKPAQPSGERCLTQSVDFGSAEGIKSTLPVHMASTHVVAPVVAPLADLLNSQVAMTAEPSPQFSPPDRLALLSSLLI